ncbi:sulfur globule protein CV2 domain protein [Cooperia oncophora]
MHLLYVTLLLLLVDAVFSLPAPLEDFRPDPSRSLREKRQFGGYPGFGRGGYGYGRPYGGGFGSPYGYGSPYGGYGSPFGGFGR